MAVGKSMGHCLIIQCFKCWIAFSIGTITFEVKHFKLEKCQHRMAVEKKPCVNKKNAMSKGNFESRAEQERLQPCPPLVKLLVLAQLQGLIAGIFCLMDKFKGLRAPPATFQVVVEQSQGEGCCWLQSQKKMLTKGLGGEGDYPFCYRIDEKALWGPQIIASNSSL